jgi:hypothetical protein
MGGKCGQRKMFVSKKDEVNVQFWILYNLVLCGFYRSPSIVRIVKSRRVQWAGHVSRLRKTEDA